MTTLSTKDDVFVMDNISDCNIKFVVVIPSDDEVVGVNSVK